MHTCREFSLSGAPDSPTHANALEVAGIHHLVAQWLNLLKTVEFVENALKLKRLN